MSKRLGMMAAMIAVALPASAQSMNWQWGGPSNVRSARVTTVALQDRDDDHRRHDRDRDHDRDWDRDRDWHRHHRDHDRDRDDRWRREHYRDRYRNGYGYGQYGRQYPYGQYGRQYPYGQNGQYPYYGRNPYGYGRGSYRGVLAPEWQQRFDSYYERWLRYRATNNRDEVVSMERRMRDIMVNYRIPPNTPFSEVASPGIGYGSYGYYRR